MCSLFTKHLHLQRGVREEDMSGDGVERQAGKRKLKRKRLFVLLPDFQRLKSTKYLRFLCFLGFFAL